MPLQKLEAKELIAAAEPLLQMLERHNPVHQLQIIEVMAATAALRAQLNGIPRRIVIDALHKHVTQLCDEAGFDKDKHHITVRDLQTVPRNPQYPAK